MNKRIIVLLMCLIIVIIPVVLFSAVFVVRDVDVVGIGDEFEFDENKLAADSGIPSGSSIFILSESAARHNIELKNPTIKVVNIERIFPNKVVVNITKRVPMIAINVKSTSMYALVDRELRVVDIVSDISKLNVVRFNGYALDISKDTDVEGEIIDINNKELGGFVLESIIKGYEQLQVVSDLLRSHVEYITLDTEGNRAIIMTNAGASIEVPINVKNVTLEDMVIAGVGVFNDARDNGTFPTNKGTFYYDNGWKYRA